MSKTIYSELTVDHLKLLLDNNYKKKPDIEVILIKFGATWCKPCQKIKVLCNELFRQTPDNTICFAFSRFSFPEFAVAIKSVVVATNINNTRFIRFPITIIGFF